MVNRSKELYYAVVDGCQVGPLRESELKTLIKNGMVTAGTLIWMSQLANWTQAKFVPCVHKLLLLLNKSKKLKYVQSTVKQNKMREDMISSLTTLGFKPKIVSNIVDQVLNENPDISLECGIKNVLKRII